MSKHHAETADIAAKYRAGDIGYEAAMNALTKTYRMAEARADDLLHPPVPLAKYVPSLSKPSVEQLIPQGKPTAIPEYAAAVWIESGELHLHLPGTESEGHTVKIPLDKMIPDTGMTGQPKAHHRGFAVLIDTLHARGRAFANERAIGYEGNMPKDSIEKALESDAKYQEWIAKGGKGTRTLIKRKSAGEQLLEDLGML